MGTMIGVGSAFWRGRVCGGRVQGEGVSDPILGLFT